jgi:glutaminyl-peptide cyclotransferase
VKRLHNIQGIGHFLYVLPFTLLVTACKITTPTELNREGNFNGGRALALIEEQLSFGARIPGSQAHKMTGDWIIQELEKYGWTVEEQHFSYRAFEGRNIIGKAETEQGEWVILGAHYDTRPISDRDEQNPWTPVPGANDGGSGVAVLLELARILRTEELTKNIWLVFFDLEDSGGIDEMDWIVGSTYFANSLKEFPDKVVIVDMVGDDDLQLYYERNSDPDLQREIWDVAIDMGYENFIPVSNHSLLDDHMPFIQLGIPAIDIIDFDYPYWHTTQDTFDKVSSESLERVGRTLQQWLLMNSPLANRGSGFKLLSSIETNEEGPE